MAQPCNYLNGKWVASNELAIPIDDYGFSMGATVVERLRTFGSQVFRLDSHLQRLQHSLEIVGIDSEEIVTAFQEIVPECAKRFSATLSAGDDMAVIVLVTPRANSSKPATVCVQAIPLPFAQWADYYLGGVRVAVSDIRQVPGNCWPAELKCRSRMHYYLADRDARQSKSADQAILLDQDGYVGESTTANILIHSSKQGLITPPRDRVLPGVTLQAVEEMANQLGIPFTEALFTPIELAEADEVMLVSTSICVLPVVECNGQPIAGGQPGPAYQKLVDAWSGLAGVDIVDQAQRFSMRK